MRQNHKGNMVDAKSVFDAKWFNVEDDTLFYLKHLQKLFRIKSKTKIVKISLSYEI